VAELALRLGLGRIAGVLVALLGAVVLAAWAFDWTAVKSAIPGPIQMKANAALGLLLSGAVLALLNGNPARGWRVAAQSVAALVAALGLATLAQYLFGWQFGIDEWLFIDSAAPPDTFRGRMSPYTALAFAAGGAALLALPFAPLQRGVRLVAALLLLVGAISLVGGLWEAAQPVADRLLPPMAVHAAAAMALLGAGIAWTSRQRNARVATHPLDRMSITLKVAGAMAVAFLLVAIGGGLAYRATVEMVRSTQRIVQFHEERQALGRIEAAATGAEAAQHLYLLTGVPSHRDEVARLGVAVQRDLDQLDRLTAGGALNQRMVERLRGRAQESFAALDRGAVLFAEQGFEAARRQVAVGEGRALMQALREQLQQMDSNQVQELQSRAGRAELDRRRFLLHLAVILAAMAGVFAMLVLQTRQGMIASAAADERLQRANSELERRIEDRTAKLRAGEQRMRLATEVTGVGVWEWDLATNTTHWDEQNFRIHGIEPTPDGIVSYADWSGVVLPEDLAQQESVMRATVESRGKSSRRFRIRRRSDGALRVIDAVETVLHSDAQGRALWMVGTNVDVTEHERDAQALKQSLAMYRATLDHMLEGCQVIGFDWVFRFANAEAARQGRTTPEALVGRSILDAFPGIEGSELFALMRRCMDKRSVGHIETEFFFDDGSSGWFEVTALPSPEGIVVFSFDISARRLAAEQAQRNQIELERRVAERTAELSRAREAADAANRAKSAFLAAMSHEIRTPMNGVIGMVDVLARTPLNADQVDALSTIRSSAYSLLGILDDVLDFSKIEAGRLELERAPVALPELIESVCAGLQPGASARDVDLDLFTDPTLPALVWGDDTRLRQVLTNLLSNAIKFSAGRKERRGRVAVRGEWAPGPAPRLALRVIDNGIGMAPETIERVFSSFTQAEASTTRRFGGTGLGLAICKRLVGMMGGGIAVDSHLGAGSAFNVTVPLEPVAGAAPPPLPGLDGLEAVVVGTSAFADDLARYLRHAGVRVQGAASLDAAARVAAPLEQAVVIHTSRRLMPEGDALRRAFATAGSARHLRLVRNAGPCDVDADGTTTIERNGLRRGALLRAVGVIAGRCSPEVFHDTTNESAAAPPAAPSVAEAREQGRLILIAEDDAVNRKVILRQIGMLGYAAEVAENGEQALRLWRGGRYALLLTDLHMPEMDGYTLAETIRGLELARGIAHAHRLPIVALTANAMRGEAQRALAAGIDEHMTKPLQLSKLQAVLERWLAPEAADSSIGELIAHGSTPASTPLDVTVLESLVGDDRGVVSELLEAFRVAARRAADEVKDRAGRGDATGVGAVAHRLKSSSRSVGALALGDLCAEVELACATGTRRPIADMSSRLDQAVAEVEHRITAYLQAT
jgi:PAS domain S-box-containing protein